MLLVAFLMGNGLWASAQVKVVDAESGNPVSYASVFDDATGKVLGITNAEGQIAFDVSSYKTISLQHMNYSPITVDVKGIGDNTIILEPREAYQVNEVVVGNQKHDYVRLKFYVRQYTVLNGEVAAVDEHLEYAYFNPDSKKLKERLLLPGNCYRNEAAFSGQKMAIQMVASGTFDPFMFLDLAEKPFKHFDKFNDGKRHTEYYHKDKKLYTALIRQDEKAKRTEIVIDSMFVEKPFHFTLFGVSMSDLYSTCGYDASYGKPTLSAWKDVLLTYKFTHNKSKSSVNVCAEMYVLGVDYAEKADYKALKKELQEKAKNGTLEPFVRPEGIPPFNKYVTNAIEKMK